MVAVQGMHNRRLAVIYAEVHKKQVGFLEMCGYAPCAQRSKFLSNL